MRSLVVAVSQRGVIGNQGDIPWRGSMPSDMKRFRELTTGHPVIMGRLTFESIGMPLPNRTNIVVTKKVLEIAGCVVAQSVEDALEHADEIDPENSFVIGGSRIYRDAMPYLDRLYVTEIDGVFPGDTYFPAIAEDKWVVVQSERITDPTDQFDSTFLTYERAKPSGN